MSEGEDMEQAITIGLAEAIGIIVAIVGSGTTMTFALLVYFDKKNERRIDEVKAALQEHRQETNAALAEHRQEFKADLVEHRQEFKSDLQEIKADLKEVQRNERTLTSKVDRIQGTLDVLVFGERVPEPVSRERAETTGD